MSSDTSAPATNPDDGSEAVDDGTTLAVDLGGTHLRAAVVAADGTVLSRRRRTTPVDAAVPDALPELVVELLDAWTGTAAGGEAGEAGPPRRAVVGVPGIIDHEREALVHAANLPPAWTAHLNEGWLAERIGCPVSLANDADLAAVGESTFGAGRDHRDVVFVTISTGVGAGLVVDDRLVRGAHSGGELGHTVIDRVAAVAGQPATVEDLGSGTAIGRRAAEAGLAERGAELADLVRSGHEVASGIWRSAIEAVAIGLVNLAWVVAPGIVVVGGGVGMNGDLVLPIIRDGLRRFGPAEVPEIEVANAALGDDAALAGAANWWKAVGRD